MHQIQPRTAFVQLVKTKFPQQTDYTTKFQIERIRAILPFVNSLNVEGRDIVINYNTSVIRDDNDLPLNADGSFNNAVWTNNFRLLLDTANDVAALLRSFGVEARISTYNSGYTRIEALDNGESVRANNKNLKLNAAQLQNIVEGINNKLSSLCLDRYKSVDFSYLAPAI